MAGSRNKYLAAQEEEERQQKLQAAQLDFMRKTLIHLGAAAKGLDENLDRELSLLFEKMRGASGAQVVDQMQRVHRAVDQFERLRDSLNAQSVSQFTFMVDQLLELKAPSELKKQLQNYKKSLQNRLSSWRVYPGLVNELAGIQKLVLDAAAEAPASLWQRLKGGKTLGAPNATKPEKQDTSAPIAKEQIEKATESIETNPGKQFELPESEDSYQHVAKRITRTLKNLIQSIDANDLVKHKVDIVQSRLERGMDWFALAITLEDIRDILMQRYLAADKEFSDYLQKVNEDLNSIREKLGLAVEAEEVQGKAANVFSQAVSQHVSSMQNSLQSSVDLSQLKEEVQVHIDEIQQALENFRANEAAGDCLSDQLQSLVARVQSIEHESQNARAMLEQERYKATHDSLTSLPNREAYAERAWQEFQRFKRYQRPLTMAVCDIDHFKKINDNYGHQAGDKVLVLFAKLLSKRLRKVDFIGRYGGEEFVILLPETNSDQALTVLDKIRSAICKTSFRFRDEPVKISASFGIASFKEEDLIETVFERADKALYKAKNKGRNCCVLA